MSIRTSGKRIEKKIEKPIKTTSDGTEQETGIRGALRPAGRDGRACRPLFRQGRAFGHIRDGQPRAAAMHGHTRRGLRPAEAGHILQAGLPPRRAGGCGVPDAELLPLLRGKGVHRDTHLPCHHAGGAARPVRAVRPEEVGGVPFQGGQGGGHPEREAHPPQAADKGRGGRILPPLHGLPLPPRPVLHDQLQGFGRVPEGGRPRGALLSAGATATASPPTFSRS